MSFLGQELSNYIEETQLTNLKELDPNSQVTFDLEIHRKGTMFSNSGIYQAIRQQHLTQLQRCIEYGEKLCPQ